MYRGVTTGRVYRGLEARESVEASGSDEGTAGSSAAQVSTRNRESFGRIENRALRCDLGDSENRPPGVAHVPEA